MGLQLKASNKEQGDFVVLEADTYDAVYTHLEEVTMQFGQTAKMFFTIPPSQTDQPKDVEISGLASIPKSGNLGKGSKLRSWVEAIHGRELTDGEDVNFGELSGHPCRLVLEVIRKSRDDGTEAEYNRITKIFPAKKRAGKPAAATDEPF